MNKNTFFESFNIFRSDHQFMLLMQRFLDVISDIWNYQVFKIDDEHAIQVSNIIICIVLLTIVVKLLKYLSHRTQ